MKRKGTWILVAAVFLATSPSVAQLETGALYGTVADTEGVPLPGATVSLSGVGAGKTQISNPKGGFWFLGLDPGSYHLMASLDGFSSLEYPDIDLRSKQEYASWHYPQALRLDFPHALQAYQSFDRAKTYVLYCDLSLMSSHLAELMRKDGFDAFHFKGGTPALRRLP